MAKKQNIDYTHLTANQLADLIIDRHARETHDSLIVQVTVNDDLSLNLVTNAEINSKALNYVLRKTGYVIRGHQTHKIEVPEVMVNTAGLSDILALDYGGSTSHFPHGYGKNAVLYYYSIFIARNLVASDLCTECQVGFKDGQFKIDAMSDLVADVTIDQVEDLVRALIRDYGNPYDLLSLSQTQYFSQDYSKVTVISEETISNPWLSEIPIFIAQLRTVSSSLKSELVSHAQELYDQQTKTEDDGNREA